MTPASDDTKNTRPASSATSRSSTLIVRFSALNCLVCIERDPEQALDDGQPFRVENLPDAAETLHVEPPGRFTATLTEFDEHIHDQPVAVGTDGAAEWNAVALLDDRARGARLDLRSAEVDGARAIGGAGHEVEVPEDVACLDAMLNLHQQALDIVGLGAGAGCARTSTPTIRKSEATMTARQRLFNSEY